MTCARRKAKEGAYYPAASSGGAPVKTSSRWRCMPCLLRSQLCWISVPTDWRGADAREPLMTLSVAFVGNAQCRSLSCQTFSSRSVPMQNKGAVWVTTSKETCDQLQDTAF